MQVELVYEQSCPNIEGARLQLLRAFSQLGLSPRWQEWETGRESTPQLLRGLGSPTILVNGRDASGDWADSRGECCRVYAHNEQAGRGVPALTDIVQALKAAGAKASRLGPWRCWSEPRSGTPGRSRPGTPIAAIVRHKGLGMRPGQPYQEVDNE